MPFTGDEYKGYCNKHKWKVPYNTWFNKCSIRGCYHLLRHEGGPKVFKPRFKKDNRLRRLK